MAGLGKDRSPTDSSHGPISWSGLWAILLASIGILGSLWVVMNAAGTDWAIPIAVMLVIVAFAALWSDRER